MRKSFSVLILSKLRLQFISLYLNEIFVITVVEVIMSFHSSRISRVTESKLIVRQVFFTSFLLTSENQGQIGIMCKVTSKDTKKEMCTHDELGLENMIFFILKNGRLFVDWGSWKNCVLFIQLFSQKSDSLFFHKEPLVSFHTS